MQKKTILLFLLLLLVLAGYTGCEDQPAESSNAKPSQKEIQKKNPNNDLPNPTTKGSIDSTVPNDTDFEDTSNENEATEDPKEALTKILTELQELDELLNRTD